MRISVAVVLALPLLLGLVGCETSPADAEEAVRDGLLLHVSHGGDDPHAVLMALKMATIMSTDRDVLVYFDLRGIEVVLAKAPPLQHAAFESSKVYLDRLRDSGVGLFACPSCLKAAGKSAADLARGVALADKEQFFGFTKGRILSLDY